MAWSFAPDPNSNTLIVSPFVWLVQLESPVLYCKTIISMWRGQLLTAVRSVSWSYYSHLDYQLILLLYVALKVCFGFQNRFCADFERASL